MEARGNAPSYPNGGNNVARATLNYGPLPSLTRSVFGYRDFRHSTLAVGFHTYVLEWDHEMMRFYIDNRLQDMLTVDNRKTDFYASGHFPLTAQSNSSAQQQVVENPWTPDKASVSKMAPYDQRASRALPHNRVLGADARAHQCSRSRSASASAARAAGSRTRSAGSRGSTTRTRRSRTLPRARAPRTGRSSTRRPRATSSCAPPCLPARARAPLADALCCPQRLGQDLPARGRRRAVPELERAARAGSRSRVARDVDAPVDAASEIMDSRVRRARPRRAPQGRARYCICGMHTCEYTHRSPCSWSASERERMGRACARADAGECVVSLLGTL
jgi:hypothetical protein